MSAFHRIDDVRTVPALRFINLALRLFAYKGIVRALAEKDAHDEQTGELPADVRPRPTSAPGDSRDIRQNRTIPSDAATLRTDPALAGMIEVR